MSQDLLVEIGTEELPPKSLDALRRAFAEQVGTRLEDLGLGHSGLESFATPRRLALLVRNLEERQQDQQQEVLGPPLAQAFDDQGQPQPAALGFAKRCGCAVADLVQKATDKGVRLAFVEHKHGAATRDLLAPMLEAALKQLPVARWMRWGASRVEFVRPVHWILCLYGQETIDAPILGVQPGNLTRGHRYMADQAIAISEPGQYLRVLRDQGQVLADPQERRAVIRFGVEKVAREIGGIASIDEALLDEVAALVEFPLAMAGSFDPEFLQVPQEALISSMQSHQKYFPVVDAQGKLLPRFIFVANIDSPHPQYIVAGNERVIRPRLSDARFFYQLDQAKPLASFQDQLRTILYQKQLGTLYDRSLRVAELAKYLADEIGADPELAYRAGELCKCDLASSMVQEFDDLQGIMGRYYALASGEQAEVAEAILEHYLPRQAGDRLPASRVGTCVAIADRLDILTGIFGIGQTPTGSKDPFGLRRASLALLRLLIENRLCLPLKPLLTRAAKAQRQSSLGVEQTVEVAFQYLVDRLPAYFQERGIGVELVRAVLKLGLDDVTDIVERVMAVQGFTKNPACSVLAAANKRVSNLLDKESTGDLPALDAKRLEAPAEQQLAASLQRVTGLVEPLLNQKDYTAALQAMAELRAPVDRMFDEVMIMVEDAALRANRLALLAALRNLFLQVADISELPSESS